jgi:hypothetical protein
VDLLARRLPLRSAARAIACLVAGSLGTGCYSFSSLGRARIVDPHHFEVWGAPAAVIVATGDGASIRPVGEVGLRYGLTPVVELDGAVTTLGVTFGTRLQLRRSKSLTTGLDIALAPSASWTYPNKLVFDAAAPFGWNLPGEHQIVVAPRIAYQMSVAVPNAPGPVSFVYLGASLGIALHMSQQLTIMPEVSFLGQLYADTGYASNVAGALGMQAALGFLIDF